MNIEQKIKWTKQHMPVMDIIDREFLESKPFKRLTIGACLHLTKETAILLMAIQDGGAKIVACASNPLSTQDDIVKYLKEERKMEVYGKKGMTKQEYDQGLLKVAQAKPSYVIDDGADLHHLFHERKFEYLPKGGLEQTTTGVTRIKQMNLKYPILAVNDAKMKHYFDNFFGTGQSTIDGIIRATNILMAGKIFVIAGYGYCGSGLAERARGMGCNVIITEINPIKAIQAKMNGFRVMKMSEAAKIGDIFVTVTGSINVINRDHLLNMKQGVILANSGHFDVEIDVKSAKELGINILADGRLVNLACAEGHPSEVMDTSFAVQILGLEYIIKYKELKVGVHEIPDEIDQKIANLKLDSLEIKIDTETKEQEDYSKS